MLHVAAIASCKVRPRNRSVVNESREAARERKARGDHVSGERTSEKHESDQHDDRDPGNRVRDNDAVSKLAIGRIVRLQQGAACLYSDHRFLPGKMFRGERLVSC